jgi:hypothetical protein
VHLNDKKFRILNKHRTSQQGGKNMAYYLSLKKPKALQHVVFVPLGSKQKIAISKREIVIEFIRSQQRIKFEAA